MGMKDDARAAGLSEEEINGIVDDPNIDKEPAAETKAEPEAKAEAKAEPAAGPEITDPPVTDPEVTDPEAKDEPAPKFVPQYDTSTPEGIDARIAAIKAEQAAIRKKIWTGDGVTADEWAATEERLASEREELQQRKMEAKFAQSFNEQTFRQAFAVEQKVFFREAKREGIDYTDPALRKRFDVAFKAIAEHPDNANRGIDDAQATFAEAHAMVKFLTGWKAPAPALVETKPKAPTARDVPQTLAAIPAAAPQSMEDETMVKLATLVGEERERFMASLPAKEVERLLRAS